MQIEKIIFENRIFYIFSQVGLRDTYLPFLR